MNQTAQQLLDILKDHAPDAYQQYITFQLLQHGEWGGIDILACIILVIVSYRYFTIPFKGEALDVYGSDKMEKSFIRHLVAFVSAGACFLFAIHGLDCLFTLFQIHTAPKGFIVFNLMHR